jgi:peptidoglycan/LPS O-acetylase OafA/YrhL
MASSYTGKLTRLDSLTSFRFIAALMVYLFHVGIWSEFQTGYIGVSFFFILSGFILTYNYSNKLIHLDKKLVGKFYIARFSKIYPIHLLTFFLAVPYYFFIPLKHEPILYVFQAITNITLIHSWIPFGNISFNGVSWSLSNEMFFYMILPLVITCGYKFRTKKLVLGVVIAGFSLLLLITLTLLPPTNNFSRWFAYYFPVTRSLEFIFGVFLGFVFLRTKNLKMNVPKGIFTTIEVITLSLLILIILLSPNILQNLRYGMVFIPFMGLLIITFAFQKGLLSRLLSNKVLIYLGEISFSFYMIHNLVLSYIFFLWKPQINQNLLIVICLLVSIILSSIMYHFYEEPMRIKVKNRLGNKFSTDQSVVETNKKVV